VKLLAVLLVGCATSSRAPDAGAGDADADTDSDSDADLDCTAAGGPAGMVPVQGCGPPVPADRLPLCADDVGGCVRDEQCTVVSFDDCCGFDLVAVVESHEAQVRARVPECTVKNPGCIECAPTRSEAQCLDERCVLVDCSMGCY
jgi:hypothetical protein